jgi:hypothetical protein
VLSLLGGFYSSLHRPVLQGRCGPEDCAQSLLETLLGIRALIRPSPRAHSHSLDNDKMCFLLLSSIVLLSVATAHVAHSSQQPMLLVPEIPRLGSLRLATLKDVPRIGVVAAASFYHSPYFHYQRPDHQRFPFDTVASYRTQFTNAILGNESVVIVAEDTPENDEIDYVYDELKQVYRSQDSQNSLNSSKIIIGVCSLKLLANSKRTGQFLPEDSDASAPEPDPENLERDQSGLANKLLRQALFAPERR